MLFSKLFIRFNWFSLVLIYLVVVAGSFVRVTGSGMGCPDWPKCFGYYIPPTELKELLFTPGKEYDKGQVIIKDETLLVAKIDFVANNNFEKSNSSIWTNLSILPIYTTRVTLYLDMTNIISSK